MRTPPRNFVPEPFAYHEEIEVDVTTLTNLGDGLGRVGEWVVMIPFALPGERVRARVFRNHKNYSNADLVEVLEASSHRVEPQCELFRECGGCQYQNYAYGEQLEWKRRQVVELLERLAGLTVPVEPTYPSPREYGYRSKITPHFRRAPRRDRPVPIGFDACGSRRVVDVEQCPIATAGINAALPEERRRILSLERKYRRGGTLLLRDTLEGVVTEMDAIVSQRVGDLVFQFQAGEFFQNNPFILPGMVGYVIAQARGGEAARASEGAETPGGGAGSTPRFLVDAYCGVGVFGLSAAARFEHCTGIDVNPVGVRWAEANALINGISNCSFKLGEAEAIFRGLQFEPAATAVIIDPPRRGCDEFFLRQLFAFGPARVVYVSCGPDTQARDLKLFLQSGYQVERVQPFDLFPQTRHIENVVTLRRGV